MHGEANSKVRVVIEIGARGNDPVDETGFDEWNECGNSETGGCQRTCQRKADRDLGLQHFLCKELTRLAQSRGVVGKEGFVN